MLSAFRSSAEVCRKSTPAADYMSGVEDFFFFLMLSNVVASLLLKLPCFPVDISYLPTETCHCRAEVCCCQPFKVGYSYSKACNIISFFAAEAFFLYAAEALCSLAVAAFLLLLTKAIILLVSEA